MIDYILLKNEILNDTLALGYSGKSDSEIANILNSYTTGRLINRDIIDTWEIFEATVPAEWSALTAAEKQRYQTIISAGQVSVKGANVRASLGTMFITGTTTRTNLIALQQKTGSRAEELFGQSVSHLDVAFALRG
jgi:hypothetical protein